MTDAIADLVGAATKLGQALHPRTAANLADLVRIANTYYSNLIEGHNTRPRDIERALAGDLSSDKERRNLQMEAAAHVRLQAEIDRLAAEGNLGEPAAPDFLRWLHCEFYKDATEDMLRVRGAGREFRMAPGKWARAPNMTLQSAGTSRLPARASPTSWRISPNAIGWRPLGPPGD